MGRTFRLKLLIIALVFVIITAGGIAAAFAIGKRAAMSALIYGSGTADDPYRIYNASQFTNLQEIADSSVAKEYTEGKYFKLYGDVKSTRTPAENSSGFYGHFDGNGHTVTVKDFGLFYKLEKDASITNLNIKIDIKQHMKNALDKYGICYSVEKGALIENCKVIGNIDVDFTAVNGKGGITTPYASAVCFENDGTIRGCEYSGIITEKNEAYAGSTIWICGISRLNYGTIEDCTVNCDMDLIVGAARYVVHGVANGAKNCVYNGNITVSRNTKNKYAGSVLLEIVGIGLGVSDCTFNGDITLDNKNMTEYKTYVYVSDGGSVTHNGDVIQLNKKAKAG